MLVTEAWNNVQAVTIKNCWNHTKIQPQVDTNTYSSTPDTATTSYPSPMADTRAWMVVRTFAMLEELPLATDWDPVLKIVMDAENNISKALEGLDMFTLRIFGCHLTQLTLSHTPQITATPAQLSNVEKDLSAVWMKC